MMSIQRSLLFIPGNSPGMLQNGGVFGADSVILDLEDAVSPLEKDAARLLVANALKKVDYGRSKKVVRINPLDTPMAKEDIAAIVPCSPDALLVPKVQTAEDIKAAASLISSSEKTGQEPVRIIALIETPRGLKEAYNIAVSDARVIALAFGAEDFTAAVGAIRTKEGKEVLTARSLMVTAAAAAGIDALDTPFTDVNDEPGLVEDTLLTKQLGFKGKMAVNPRQVDIIHSIFNPSDQEIQWAERVVQAIRQAEAQGSGVISVDGKMVDAPIVNRAERVLLLAGQLGLREDMKND